ncbi:MAG TPA: ABC transporter permease, partial [Gemmatimonadaceae bacterium]
QKPHSYAGYLTLRDSTLINGKARYAGRNAATPADMDRIESALRQSVMMVRLGKEGVRPEVIKDLSKIRASVEAERISETGKAGSATAALAVGFFLAFLLYASIIFHGQNVLRGVQEEKSTRVAEVVLSSVKPDTLLAGKVLGVGAVGLLQQILWLVLSSMMISYLMPLVMSGVHSAVVDTAVVTKGAVPAAAAPPAGNPAMAVLNVITPTLIATVLAFFFSGFIFYASLFAAAGAMVNSDQEANQAAMPVMMLLIFTIIFLNPIIMNANGPLAIVLSWLPFSSPIVMPTRMALGAAGIGEAVGAWLVSVLGCVAAVWVGARIYRVGMLMYGKRPNFKELVKWVRYA